MAVASWEAGAVLCATRKETAVPLCRKLEHLVGDGVGEKMAQSKHREEVLEASS